MKERFQTKGNPGADLGLSLEKGKKAKVKPHPSSTNSTISNTRQTNRLHIPSSKAAIVTQNPSNPSIRKSTGKLRFSLKISQSAN